MRAPTMAWRPFKGSKPLEIASVLRHAEPKNLFVSV